VSKEAPNVAEIAKRIFVQGTEISPIPPDIVTQARADVSIYPMLVRLSQERDVAKAHERGPVLDLAAKWYRPQDVKRLEIALLDPRDSRALLKGVCPSENPWTGLALADVETEMDFVLLKQVGDKALNLSKRLRTDKQFSNSWFDHLERSGAGPAADATIESPGNSISAREHFASIAPKTLLASRLLQIARSGIGFHDSNSMNFALDLEQLSFALDSLDAYVKRRQAHQRQKTVARNLVKVHEFLKELEEDEDFDVDDF